MYLARIRIRLLIEPNAKYLGMSFGDASGYACAALRTFTAQFLDSILKFEMNSPPASLEFRYWSELGPKGGAVP